MTHTTRIALAYLVLTWLLVGCWACGFPRGFYDAFPGLGHTWVSVYGAFDEHLVRDVGAVYLVIAALAGLCLVRPATVTPFAVGFATLFFNLPHLV